MSIARSSRGLLALALLLAAPRCGALDNGLARTPPMGFNTWNGLQDDYNESIIVEIIDRMSEQLLPYGYRYVVLTEEGMPTARTGPRRASDTTFRVDEPRFPQGMKYLADHAHSKGMLFGLYTSGSRITCEQRWGSLYHEAADAALFASWGVDWVWYDECSESHLSQRAKIGAMKQALNRTGRPMIFQCWNLRCEQKHGRHEHRAEEDAPTPGSKIRVELRDGRGPALELIIIGVAQVHIGGDDSEREAAAARRARDDGVRDVQFRPGERHLSRVQLISFRAWTVFVTLVAAVENRYAYDEDDGQHHDGERVIARLHLEPLPAVIH
jgi:hypothetical protein